MKQADADHSASLKGLRVLVVEDQFLVAEDLAQTLTDWGCEVLGPAAEVKSALKIVASHTLDGAILDINLGHHETSFPVAAVLRQRDVPFVFLTGNAFDSSFPQEYAEFPRLSKPMRLDLLASAVATFARAQLVSL